MADRPLAPLDLSVQGRFHIVGVGGPGMSALALVLAEMGHAVSGSDLREVPVLDRLRSAGVDVHIGHDRRLVEGCDAVTYSTAIPERNSEVVASRDLGIPTLHRAGMLASICSMTQAVGVAGTHGKTTTSSMLMLVLAAAGMRPSFVIGGDVTDIGTGAQWTGSEWAVVEADESDFTHLQLPLAASILTNVDVDHLENYGSFEAIVAGFEQYLDQIDGPRVLCADDAVCRRLSSGRSVITYGTATDADYRIVDARADAGNWRFAVTHRGSLLGEVHLPLRGMHNVLNATSVVAMAHTLGVRFDVIAASLERFGGVARRLDFRGRHGGATFVDDYAHIPNEISAVIDALRSSGDGFSRVVAVFQPNRYRRMALMSPEYRDAFAKADLAVITDIYPSGDAPIPGVTGKLVVNAILDAHPYQQVVWLPRRHDLIEYLAREVRAGDVCVSMGCGDVASLPSEVLALRLEMEAARGARMSGSVRGSAVERAADILGQLGQREVPLAPLTTYRVGGAARLFVRVEHREQLVVVSDAVRASSLPVAVIGRGSNLLVADTGFDGIAVTFSDAFAAIEILGTEVVAGGFTLLPVLARRTVAAGLTGLEWAVGVPGSVGGGVRMNAGGHGSDVAANLIDVDLFDLASGSVTTAPAASLGLRFRGSDLRDEQLVLAARFSLDPGDIAQGEAELAEVVRWRREHQPGGQNAGSVFVNPIPGELAAGQVIDELGLRGTRIGSAYVSDKHANFIQATEGGTAADVRAVIELVRDRVWRKRGIRLRSEIRMIGFDGVES